MTKEITGRDIGAPDFVRELRTIIYPVRSDKDTHFTGAIAQDGVERETLANLRSDRVRISKISIQAIQQLRFQVLLYSTEDYDESNLDNDKFVASVDLDLVRYGFQQTTSQYRMDMQVAIDYLDEDETKSLHVVLKNLDPTAKIAGANGQVVLEFTCEARA